MMPARTRKSVDLRGDTFNDFVNRFISETTCFDCFSVMGITSRLRHLSFVENAMHSIGLSNIAVTKSWAVSPTQSRRLALAAQNEPATG